MAQLTGRLTKDARVLTSEDGREFIAFTVAENFSYKTKEGERKQLTSYVDCAYGRSTKLAPYLTKGTIVSVSGRLKPRIYTNRRGEQQAGIQMQTKEITLQGGGTKAGNNNPQHNDPDVASTAAVAADDLPF